MAVLTKFEAESLLDLIESPCYCELLEDGDEFGHYSATEHLLKLGISNDGISNIIESLHCIALDREIGR